MFRFIGREEETMEPGAIRAAAERRRSETVERVRQLVELESPTGDGDAVDAVVDVMAARLQALGAVIARTATPGGSHLVAELPGAGALASAPPALLLGHSDTVWPVGTLIGSPWSAERGVIRGPGSLDMKSGLAIIEAALAVTHELGGDRMPARVVVCCDEEIGSPSFDTVFRQALTGVSCVLGFEAPHPDGGVKVGRWGSTRLRLSVAGRAAHAALDPQNGVSAIDELVDQLLRVREIVADEGGADGGTLLNTGAVSGGGRANVVPDGAEALLGLRFAAPDVERRVLDRILSLAPLRAGAVVEAEILSQRPAWEPGEASAGVVSALARISAELGMPFRAAEARGAADTNLSGAMGVPTIDGLGPIGGGAHALSEHASIDAIVDRVALVAAFLTTAVMPASPAEP
ncbi:MAG TPA: M20/M25/M40 family metallo-hydrolase [Gryllotalpicola sp.]